ncbi:MAG: type II toxin-antitoxin system VapC family toxin [Actinomycetota bacterium]|nr:type II toxin-antitoxin system VapC family toxin [Actinomycetota bacterium]
MRPVVLDTDVSSQILKNRLTGPLAAKLIGTTWCVTFVTVGELWQWAEIRHWGSRTREQLEDWLSHVVVLDSDETVSRTWGQICADAKQRGRTHPVNDSWIAACCLANELPLATLNTKDFADLAEHNGLVMMTS